MHRSKMTPMERESRSRLKPYITGKEFLRATPTMRRQTCGKPNCRCRRGEKHICLVLSRSLRGKIEQLYVPKEKEQMVKQWIKNWRDIQDLLEKISSTYWERLKRKD